MELDVNELEDKRRLNLTLNIRENLISGLLVGGKLPEDKSSRETLVKLLDGMDRTVLAKTKIKSDEKIANDQKQAAALISEVLYKVEANRSSTRTNVPELPEEIIINDIVPGEASLKIESFNYEDIVKN